MKKQPDKRRRELLGLGIIAGAGALTGSGIQKVVMAVAEDKVKMLLPDGRLVEVDKKHLPKDAAAKKLTNAELKEWVDRKGQDPI